MSMATRQPKPTRKGPPSSAGRPQAWTGARASPTYSPANSSTPRPSSAASPTSQNSFPPLGQVNGAGTNGTQDRNLQSIAGLTGTTITLVTKTGQRYEGVVGSTSSEGDTTGVTLKTVKDLSESSAPSKDTLFIASTNIDTWSSGPADAKLTNGDNAGFRTDTDISGKKGSRERELQAWQPDAPISAPSGESSNNVDEETFGPGASGNKSWDQFAANEKLFGVTASFDEDVYTTKLDRSGADFKEREKKAQKLANEIMGATTSNPHVAEERNQADDSGVNEEDKYGAVVRGQNAYVPPGARKQAATGAGSTANNASIPKVSVSSADGTTQQGASASSSQAPSPSPSAAAATKPPADPLPAFRDFVTNEKQRLMDKRKTLVKNDMDKRMADLLKFSQSFKLNKPIPDDLVPILAKDEEKQRAIKEKSTKDAASSAARSIGPSNVAPAGARAPQNTAIKLAEAGRKPSAPTGSKNPSASNTPPTSKTPTLDGTKKAPAAAAPAKGGKPLINMVIQAIPPFRGKTSAPPAQAAPIKTGTTGTTASKQVQPPTPNRLNVNASSFRPNPKASSFTPTLPSPGPGPVSNGASASVSPKPKDAQMAPNAFFGPRSLKRGPPVNIKDDFNPFKQNSKLPEASTISPNWPYNGKRYAQMFPPSQHPPQQHSPHVPAPMPPPMPPPPYEEDPNAAAARAQGGYVYYPPYGYPPQPMMPGMPPPGPPGSYMPGPYMQPMPYPPGAMPPNAMYVPPGMQMPPPHAYMPPPPPGQYPQPPNGAAPRPSMPPTPIPAQAHAYYQQSPQLQHAVPYPMMMPPPPNAVPQHPYEGQPAAPPVPMGGAHP